MLVFLCVTLYGLVGMYARSKGSCCLIFTTSNLCSSAQSPPREAQLSHSRIQSECTGRNIMEIRRKVGEDSAVVEIIYNTSIEKTIRHHNNYKQEICGRHLQNFSKLECSYDIHRTRCRQVPEQTPKRDATIVV